MNIEQPYNYPQPPELGCSGQGYQYNGQNTLIANGARSNPRVCPMRGSIGGTLHPRGGREDDGENGQARKRVAMACARCRKRKIRCSGDPGDGSGCQNCRQAGAKPETCVFHRVGEVAIDFSANLNQVANSHAVMYNLPASPIRPRPFTYPPALDTKSVYSHMWTIPHGSPYNSEEVSPVETYGLDHSAAYLPNQTSVACGNGYRWSIDGKPAPSSYMVHDSIMYSPHGQPYMQHNIRTTTSSETLSSGMNGLQLTLPERPHTRSGLSISQGRQLPPPQPSPAQTSRNVVDKLQDERLRSTRAMTRSSLGNGGFVKPSLPYTHDADIQVTAAAGVLAGQLPASTSVSTADSVTYYPATTPTATDGLSIAANAQFNFNTFPLFEASPTATQPAYSNVRHSRDAKALTSSARSAISQQTSHSENYTLKSGQASDNILGGNNSALTNGHRYTPLSHSQSQPQHQGGLSKGGPLSSHQTHTTTINRSF